MTPTIDHTEQPERGACQCASGPTCPGCMAKIQRQRQQWAIEKWLHEWDYPAPPPPRARPLLRLVRGGR